MLVQKARRWNVGRGCCVVFKVILRMILRHGFVNTYGQMTNECEEDDSEDDFSENS